MTDLSFSPFPILLTERLTLRQVSLNDAQDIFALRSDPAINQYLDRKPSKTVEDAINFINNITENINKNESLYWSITLSENKAFIGTICLFNFSENHHKCEIGYEMFRNFQGKGIMKEAEQYGIFVCN